jgi:hypothetical protein
MSFLRALDEDRCSSSGLCFLLKNFSRAKSYPSLSHDILYPGIPVLLKFFSTWKSNFNSKCCVHILGFLQLLFLKKPHAHTLVRNFLGNVRVHFLA